MPLRRYFEGASVQQVATIYIEMRHTSSDRIAAISCAAILEDTLGTSISCRLIEMGADWEDRVFRDRNAPLGDFQSRIILAYAMGLIGPSARADLDLIRSVRNDFAHLGAPLTFNDPDISEKCNKISQRRSIDDFDYPDWLLAIAKDTPTTPCNKFISASEWIAIDLTTIRLRRLRPIYPSVLR